MNANTGHTIQPLPEALPEGEHVLMQCSPSSWRAFSRRVFQLYKIALYLLMIVAWVAISAYLEHSSLLPVLQSLAWTLPPALAVLGLIALLGRFYTRTTVYTITNQRIVIETGLSYTTYTNIPYSQVERADLKTFSDHTGEIELRVAGERMLYSMLWPSVRTFRLRRPVPVLRAIHYPETVASLLGQALLEYQEHHPPQPTMEHALDDSAQIATTPAS
ncbi:MAG: photosynthetic complex putative assembly protein PuhB [Pseudomonadota bacterium]